MNEKKNDFLVFNENLLKNILNVLTTQPIQKDSQIVENYSPLNYLIGGTSLRPYLSIQNFEEQCFAAEEIIVGSNALDMEFGRFVERSF